MHKCTQLALSAGLASLVANCGPPPRAPEPIDPERGAIGIQASMRKPIGIGSDAAQIVYFARLEEGDGIETVYACENVVATNFAEGDRLLLLNARPGTYAAVAATFAKQDLASMTPQTGTSVPSTVAGGEPVTYRTYFTKDVIARTCFTIAPGSFTYIGALKIGTSIRMTGCDEAQRHYQQVIEGPIANQFILGRLGKDVSWRGSLLELRDDAASEQDFVAKVGVHLQGTGWVRVLAKPHREQVK